MPLFRRSLLPKISPALYIQFFKKNKRRLLFYAFSSHGMFNENSTSPLNVFELLEHIAGSVEKEESDEAVLLEEYIPSEKNEETTPPLDTETTLGITKKEFTNTQIVKLDARISETYLTPRYVEQLQALIGIPEDWRKKTQSQRKQIEGVIADLGLYENEWKYRSYKNTHDPNSLAALFPRGFEQFEARLNDYIYPRKEKVKGKEKEKEKDTQRSNKNFFLYKFKYIVRGFSSLLRKSGNAVYDEIINFNEVDWVLMVQGFVNARSIFNDFMRIVLRKASENIFNHEIRQTKRYHDLFTENSLAVNRQAVIPDFQKTLPLYYMSIAFNYLKETNPEKYANLDAESLLKEARYTLFYKPSLFAYKTSKNVEDMLDRWWGENVNHAMSILLIFESIPTGLFKHILSETKQNKESGRPETEITYVLPPFLDDAVTLRGVDIPRLTPPENITQENVDWIVKPLLFGAHKISRSVGICETLNIAQQRCFKVNVRFVKLLHTLILLSERKRPPMTLQDFKLPFSTAQEYTKLAVDLDELKKAPLPKAPTSLFMLKLNAAFASAGIEAKVFSQIQTIVNSSQLEASYFNKEYSLSEQIAQKSLEIRHAKTCLTLAKLLDGFDLYVTNTMDVRGRLYPNFKLFARTAGVYKHFLCEKKETTLTGFGLKNLMRAYFFGETEKFEKFEAFLMGVSERKKTFTRELFEFFHANYLDFTKTGEPLYFMLLHIELLTAKKTNKTAINVEIDQTASGIVFLAFLTRNTKLAEVANIISLEKSCPYNFCREKFSEFYEKFMKKRSEKFYTLATTSRKMHKYALMCFCYNQTHKGRLEDFVKTWEEEYHEKPSDEDFACLAEFATKYPKFLDWLFPGIIRQFAILEEMVALLIKELSAVTIKTLDGETLQWSFYKTASQTRSAYNPVTSSFYSYRNTHICTKKTEETKEVNGKIKTKKVDDTDEEILDEEDFSETFKETLAKTKGTPIDDIRGAQRRFLAFLVHSIDAAVIRRFIRLMKQKHSYVINHLHDCVIIHPNYVDDFYEIVKNLYSSNELYDMIDNLVFTPFLQNISSEGKPALEILIREYKSLSNNFEERMGNFNPRYLYKFEH